MAKSKKASIFCSASLVDEKYVENAKQLSKYLVKNGYDLLYGGSDRGNMKVIADTFQELGAKVYGVSVGYLKDFARKNLTELTVAETLDERKRLLLSDADVVFVLPGGIGTIDELFFTLENAKHGLFHKKIFVFNFDGFYDHIEAHINHLIENDFAPIELKEIIYFIGEVDEIHL
jgi:uncharacterized protein (TIGR00730 family)